MDAHETLRLTDVRTLEQHIVWYLTFCFGPAHRTHTQKHVNIIQATTNVHKCNNFITNLLQARLIQTTITCYNWYPCLCSVIFCLHLLPQSMQSKHLWFEMISTWHSNCSIIKNQANKTTRKQWRKQFWPMNGPAALWCWLICLVLFCSVGGGEPLHFPILMHLVFLISFKI